MHFKMEKNGMEVVLPIDSSPLGFVYLQCIYM